MQRRLYEGVEGCTGGNSPKEQPMVNSTKGVQGNSLVTSQSWAKAKATSNINTQSQTTIH